MVGKRRNLLRKKSCYCRQPGSGFDAGWAQQKRGKVGLALRFGLWRWLGGPPAAGFVQHGHRRRRRFALFGRLRAALTAAAAVPAIALLPVAMGSVAMGSVAMGSVAMSPAAAMPRTLARFRRLVLGAGRLA